MKIKAIIFGVTGMVGEGILHECLGHSEVEKVLVVGRRTCGLEHAKLAEVLLPDLGDLSSIADKFKGYNACYFSLGVSAMGKNEQEYTKLTYDLTMDAAKLMAKANADMTFCYISGRGTDSTEKGGMMWARVKGKTENDLLKLPFKASYMFRPGVMKPTPGLKNTLGFYKYLGWSMPLIKLVFPGSFGTLEDVGLAMINVTLNSPDKRVLEVKDIADAAKA